jgi:RNA polymerase sigma-70 factor (ECF subfamily)
MTAVTESAIDDGTAVVVAAAAGDGVAFERLVALHHEDIRRVCALVTGDDAIADEAVQAAWAIAWRKLGSVRDPKRVRAWLASIAINEARGMMRRGRRQTVVEIQASVGVTDRERSFDPAGFISAIDLRNALSRLDPDDRALLALRYVAGFDSNEIAAATGRSASGTRSRLARLLERLQKDLGDE